MSFISKTITINQVNLHLELFKADGPTSLLINPAIGVRRKTYQAFAEFMVENGVSVILYNYRGMEDGLQDIDPLVQTNAEAWGQLDQTAVIDWITKELKPEKLFVLGHSLGGQLLGFADNIDRVDGVIHVAAQKGDYRLWPFMGRLKLMLLWYVLIPMMSRGKLFNAKKLGLGTYPWPAAAAKQWACWGQQKDYLFNPSFNFDLSPWHNFTKPILSFGFTDDEMAPEAAIDGLLAEFGKSVNDNRHIEKRIIDPKSIGLEHIGHFGFFKPSAQQLWQDTAAWIHQTQTN
jgi:predicted alpha/beta hydrolase